MFPSTQVIFIYLQPRPDGNFHNIVVSTARSGDVMHIPLSDRGYSRTLTTMVYELESVFPTKTYLHKFRGIPEPSWAQ